ncbi:MAG: hypothetical protein AMS16_07200 [Planctomycetes bacterium DG_58]|nr:MAG: hypothetical protein AMS16_07200 [Planctomycetes bacterium DG_58]
MEEAQAISAGDGGRLYITHRGTEGETSYCYIESLKINTDWTIDLEGRADYTYADHGKLVDNYVYQGSTRVIGISPELIQGAGDGVGAKLVMGLFYNNDPTEMYRSGQTMDVLEVTTGTGSSSVNLLGDGLGQPDAAPTWAGGHGSIGYPCTERGYFAAPDPNGGFTGSASNCVVDGRGRYSYLSVVSDTNSDGDCTDNGDYSNPSTMDYVDYTTTLMEGEQDQEILGNRMYVSQGWAGWTITPYGTTHALGYYENTGSSLDRKAFIWRDNSIMTQWKNPDGGPNYEGGFHMSCLGLAMTRVQDENGVYHDATYCTVQTGFSWWGAGGTGYNNYSHIALCVDLNDDGDAMDNDIGEITYIYSNTTVPGGWNDPHTSGQSEMEIIKSEDSDNKMFLMVQQTIGGWHLGYVVWVMELQDNGDYVGGTDGVVKILQTWSPDPESWSYSSGSSIEFDKNMIPEPATLLLLGTSALGVLGYLRRRRMR